MGKGEVDWVCGLRCEASDGAEKHGSVRGSETDRDIRVEEACIGLKDNKI